MSDRPDLVGRLAPAALLLVLGVAVLLPGQAGSTPAATGDDGAGALRAVLDDLPEDAAVLIGFDPDVGTYPEIRPTVRELIADLLARGATIAFVSLTPDGRALALAELERMDRLEANPRQVVDLGFVPGAEAALVALVRELTGDTSDPISVEVPAVADLPTLDLGVVVGGIDIGPRSWVEQVAPRTEDLPLVAVAPTVLLPELLPYRESGQLAALLGTPMAGAAYRADAELGPLERLTETDTPPTGLALLIGAAVAAVVLALVVGQRIGATLSSARGRESP